jgi:kumamolisin
VRANPAAAAHRPSLEEYALAMPGQRKAYSDAEIEQMYGASPADLDAVEKFAAAYNLKVLNRSAIKRSVLLQGTIGDISRAFSVKLGVWEHQDGNYRGRTGPISVPAELSNVVTAVFGLDNRRVGRSYRRKSQTIALSHASSSLHGYLPTDVARAYHFPPQLDGTGQCIAILAFNGAIMDTGDVAPGGYDPKVLKNYFSKVVHVTPPKIQDHVIHGPGNAPGDMTRDDDSTGEILLDLQVAGSIAPGAKIVVYFTEFTEQGWVDALQAIVNDTENRPSVLSISYGNAETLSDANNPNLRGSLWTRTAIEEVNAAFQVAASRNITICCASGDDGSSDGVGDHLAHADFPASSPFVLGCGGTRLVIAQNGTIQQETVWNDSNLSGGGGAGGGGISDMFGLPSWQNNANVPPSVNPGHRIGRGVPDVSGLADYITGMIIADIDGNVDSQHPTGGTSATAPLWAALVARLNQGVGARLGFVNPLLYTRFSTGVLRDITSGNNGRYKARSGWDATTGLGSPDGVKLLQAFSSGTPVHAAAAVAGVSEQRVQQLEERIAKLEAMIAPEETAQEPQRFIKKAGA